MVLMVEIKQLYQPAGSTMCGQTCIAMVAGIGLDAACKAVGHSHSTKTREIVQALRNLGLKCGCRLLRVGKRRSVPRFGIVRKSFGRGVMGHWVVVWDGVVIDPDRYSDGGGKITSFIEIFNQ